MTLPAELDKHSPQSTMRNTDQKNQRKLASANGEPDKQIATALLAGKEPSNEQMRYIKQLRAMYLLDSGRN